MAVVTLEKLTKIYDRGQLPAADAVSLEVRHGLGAYGLAW